MILEGDPFVLIEGMTIASIAMGATQGFIYVRSEYPHAIAGAISLSVLVTVSAPTALAVSTAEASSIALVAVARNDGFEIFTDPQRIREEQTAHGLVSNVLA